MWQETMNQGTKGIKEVGLTPGSVPFFFLFWACLACPTWQGRRAALALPFELHQELDDGRENPGLAWHAQGKADLGPVLIATGLVLLSVAIVTYLWKDTFLQ